MDLINTLKQHDFKTVLPGHLQHGKAIILHAEDPVWSGSAMHSVESLMAITQKLMLEEGAVIALGQYAEDRAEWYQRSRLFSEADDLRAIHLGIDLGVEAGTAVFAPLDARVHSFQDNIGKGDYGPTVILEHELDSIQFFTLYGHLDRESLNHLNQGQIILAGDQFASVGGAHENGEWPPHLHFQIIQDLGNYHGDYPGVASKKEADYFLSNCLDPNLILNISALRGEDE